MTTCNECGYLQDKRCWHPEKFKYENGAFLPLGAIGCSRFKSPRDFDGFEKCSKCRYNSENNGTNMGCNTYRRSVDVEGGINSCGTSYDYWRPVVKPPAEPEPHAEPEPPPEPEPPAEPDWAWVRPECTGCKYNTPDNDVYHDESDWGHTDYITCKKYNRNIKSLDANLYKKYTKCSDRVPAPVQWAWVAPDACDGCKHYTDNGNILQRIGGNTMECNKLYMIKTSWKSELYFITGKDCPDYKKQWAWVVPDRCDGCKSYTENGKITTNSKHTFMECKNGWVIRSTAHNFGYTKKGKSCSQYLRGKHVPEWQWEAPDRCDGCRHWTDDGPIGTRGNGQKYMTCKIEDTAGRVIRTEWKPRNNIITGKVCPCYRAKDPPVRCRDCQHTVDIFKEDSEYFCKCMIKHPSNNLTPFMGETNGTLNLSITDERECNGFAEKTCKNCAHENERDVFGYCHSYNIGKIPSNDFKWACG